MTAAAGREPRLPPVSVNQLCLPRTSFADDVALAAELGYSGIAIDLAKLGSGPDDYAIALMQRSGLAAGVCCNSVWSILPIPNFPTPADPTERIESICAGVRRLAPFRPESVFCVLGQPGEHGVSSAWRMVEDGLRRIHDVALESGVTLSIETMTREGGRRIEQPMVATIEQTLALVDRLGLGDVRVVVDIWHLHDSPGLLDALRTYAGQISAVQMCDYHAPRSWRDRLLPGDGEGRVPEALAALEEGGFTGWLDLEVFSDELWKDTPREFMANGLAAIRRCWSDRHGGVGKA